MSVKDSSAVDLTITTTHNRRKDGAVTHTMDGVSAVNIHVVSIQSRRLKNFTCGLRMTHPHHPHWSADVGGPWGFLPYKLKRVALAYRHTNEITCSPNHQNDSNDYMFSDSSPIKPPWFAYLLITMPSARPYMIIDIYINVYVYDKRK